MNKLVTLLASSLLGIGTLTSVAVAQPSIELDAKARLDISFGTPKRVVHHGGWWYQLPMYRRVLMQHPAVAPVVIAAPHAWLNLGTVGTGKQVLVLDRYKDRNFDTLQLDASARVELRRMVIEFANHQEQTVLFDGVLAHGQPRTTIQLAGQNRGIASITFYSAASSRGTISVRGRDDARRLAPAKIAGFTRLGTVSTGVQKLERLGKHSYDLLALSFKGKVHLDRVIIEYANGARQVMTFGMTFTASSYLPLIDLDGSDRQIKSVTVKSDPGTGAEIAVLAK